MAGELLAYCGIDCAQCPAYIATQDDDREALAKVAEEWGKEYGVSFTAENCICDGCTADGRKIGYCDQCAVRACAVKRGVVNCAHCADYACQTLSDFLAQAPHAKAALEAIRSALE